MVCAHVYTLDKSASGFLKLADAEGLIRVFQCSTPPEKSVFIQRFDSCACYDTEKLIVDGDSIIVNNGQHEIVGYPAYVLPPDWTEEEVLTIVTWLSRRKFHTFTQRIMFNTLNRFLEPARFFKVKKLNCGGCYRHKLNGLPVFFLKHTVLSSRNKGPTLESVVL